MARQPRVLFALAAPASVDPVTVDKVVRVAAALNAEVELFQCVFDRRLVHRGSLFHTRPVQSAIRDFVDGHHRQLERLALRLRARGVRARSSVRWDYPAYEGIIRQVLRHRPMLLIVQSSHRTGLSRRLLRTDFRLIERCPGLILLLNGRQAYPEVPVVLAAVDTRDAELPAPNDEIIETAKRFSSALAGKLAVFHAHLPWDDAVRANPALRDVPAVVKNDVYSAYLDTIRSQVMELMKRHDVPASRVRMLEGEISSTLPIAAVEARADIVVLGAVHRSMLGKALRGHTAERALEALKCDVLVVKAPAFRISIDRQSTHHLDRSADVASRIVL